MLVGEIHHPHPLPEKTGIYLPDFAYREKNPPLYVTGLLNCETLLHKLKNTRAKNDQTNPQSPLNAGVEMQKAYAESDAAITSSYMALHLP